MRLRLWVLALAVCGLSLEGCSNLGRAPRLGAIGSVEAQPIDDLPDQLNSLSELVYQLAAERFEANHRKGQRWILTVHQGGSIRRYTDGRHTLVSLPAHTPADRAALSQYASSYNAFSERRADEEVQSGRYSHAKDLYRLLIHFDCGGERERYEAKLGYLSKIEAGSDTKGNLARFLELSDDLLVRLKFSDIERVTPQVVSNLLEISWP